MNTTFYLEQVAKTVDLNADLIMKQHELDKMTEFIEIKSTNSKLKQCEKAQIMKMSSSTLQRYRRRKKV